MSSRFRGIQLPVADWQRSCLRYVVPALVAAIALVASPATAGAAGTGSISGTITDAGDAPVFYFCVEAYDSVGKEVSSAKSKADGSYKLEGLGTGDYRVKFRRCGTTNNLITEFYENKQTLEEATTVSVTDGADTPDIDAQLASGGTISGTITSSESEPLRNICVDAYDSNGTRAGYASSNADGSYTVIGLPSGEYRLEYRSCSYPKLNLAPAEAAPVSVTAGVDTPGVDVEMATGGSISGNSGGATWTGSYYCLSSAVVYDSEGEYVSSDLANDSGEYKIQNLKTGVYRVEFKYGCVTLDPSVVVPSPMTGFYRGAKSLADATPISVTEGSETPGIDAWFAPDDRHSITGTVTDESGSPLRAICIRAYDSDGNGQALTATGPKGTYSLGRLDPGSYRIKFEDCFGSYIWDDGDDQFEFYEDKTTLDDATPVLVSGEEDVISGIDVRLATRGITDTTPPDTMIDSGPSGTITTDEATFTFSSTELSWIVQSFECKIDSGAFEACTSPKTFSGLSDGEHTVAVRAEDYWGNKDETPATRTFTVDTGSESETETETETPAYKAAIGKVTVMGPARIKKGKKATYRIRITNSGNTDARGVGVRARVRGVTSSSSIGSVSTSSTRVVKVRLKPKKPGKARITFRITSSNAGAKTVTKAITVRK